MYRRNDIFARQMIFPPANKKTLFSILKLLAGGNVMWQAEMSFGGGWKCNFFYTFPPANLDL